MKLAAALFTAMVAFATVNCHALPSFGKGPLYEDIQYFLDMIPMDSVADVVLRYAASDAEFQQLLKYFRNTEFKTMLTEIEDIPEFHVFADYLQNNGVYIYKELNKLNKIVGIPPFEKTFATRAPITGGLKGLFEDVKALVDYDDFIHGYVYKMRRSAAFKDFVTELTSPRNQEFVNHLYSKTNFLKFREMLVSKGLDITLIEDVLYCVLRIEFPEFGKAPALYDNQLSRDIHEFIDLIDKEKVMQIVVSYLDDDEVQRAMQYMYSEEFHVLVHQVEALPEYQDLVNYLQATGLNAYGLIQKIHKLFDMEDYVPPKHSYSIHNFVNRGGVKGLVDDVIAVLPRDKFRALFQDKMKNSPEFRSFMEKLRSAEFQKIVNAVYSSPIFLEMRQKAIDDGLNLGPVKKIIEEIIGVHLPTVPFFVFGKTLALYDNQLSRDIHEFIDLIDKEKVMQIVVSYLDDDEVQRAMQYMYSEEFHVLVHQVEALPEYQDLVNYLQATGLNAYGLIQKIHKLFDMEDYVPPKHSYSIHNFVNRGGVKGLVDDVIAVLPRDKFRALFQDKMKNSPEFRSFMEKLRSAEFQKIVNAVYSSPIFLEMRQKAIDDGLNLGPVKKIIEEIIGVHLPTVPFFVFGKTLALYDNQLSRDIHEFIDLIDKEKVMQIVVSYLDDDEVQRAMQYMYSEEFHVLVHQVEALPEYQDLVNYLQATGLNAYGLIQKIHKLFDMEDYVPPKHSYSIHNFVNRGGVKGLVDDVIAVLPRDKFRALFQDKMKNSPEFRSFMEKLRSAEFQKIVNAVYSSPIFLEMRQKAIDDGLNLGPVKKIIEEIIGVHLPTVPFFVFGKTLALYDNQLSRDIHEFIDLIDKEKVMQIVVSYLDDDEVQRAMQYMYSEEFHVLVHQVEALPEYQDLVNYLQATGLNAYGLIQKIHKLFDMEDYVPPKHSYSIHNFVNRGGVKGLVDDVIAVLPRDKFRALFQDKMKNSPEFRSFMEKLRSAEFQKIVNAVYSSPIFLEMRQKAIDDGLNLGPVKKIIEEIIGVHLPTVPMF